MTDILKPKDHAEAVALFRAQVIGPLVCRDELTHGELAEAMRELSAQPVRPPGSDVSRTYAVSTVERWLYAYRKGGLGGLIPKRRCDRGHAQALGEEHKKLLEEIRREHPKVSAALILRTLIADGRLPQGLLTETTLRRFYAERGLDRQTLKLSDREPRRRWQAARPNAVWHADVVHGPALRVGGKSVPLRIHGILDDHSRFVVAIEACTTERESASVASRTSWSCAPTGSLACPPGRSRALRGSVLASAHVTDRDDWTDEEIVRGYRSQAHVESAFRAMKDPHCLTFRPVHHWTDQKLRVHALYCVVALMILSLLRRKLAQAQISVSYARMVEQLADIREVAVLYHDAGAPSPRARTVLSDLDAEQKKMLDVLDLARFRAA